MYKNSFHDSPFVFVAAVPIALSRAKLTTKDIAMWEFNEAFAVVCLANNQVRPNLE